MPSYEPHNGRCVCQIHRDFEARNGYTVDQYYEMHPEREPWYLERCPNCPERQQQVQQGEPTQQPTPEPVVVKPVQQPEIVFVENPKQVLQESITDMCNTFVNRDACDGCDTCQAAPAISAQSAMAGLLVLGALVFLPLTVLFGFWLGIVALLMGALWLAWQVSKRLFWAFVELDSFVTDWALPRLSSATQLHSKHSKTTVKKVLLLPEPVESESIEITARPVEYVRVKYGK